MTGDKRFLEWARSIGDAARFAAGLLGGGEGRGFAVGLTSMLPVLFLAVYHLAPLRPGGLLVALFLRLPAPVRGVAYGLAIVMILLFAPVAAGSFIYAQF